MNFKEYFYLLLEYKVNINNAQTFYRVTPKEMQQINATIPEELKPTDIWYKFEILGDTYLVGYLKNNANLIFFNLSDTLQNTDKEVNFGKLQKLGGKDLFRFINTISSIMKKLVDDESVKQIRIFHFDPARRDTYFKFLQHSIDSFLPGHVVFPMGGDIVIFKPLSAEQKVDESMKGRSLRRIIEGIERELTH
jgi:hypothetical protein